MSEKLAPTRGNLVRLTHSVQMARSGHDLLDRKRQVLMSELVQRIDAAGKIQAEMSELFSDAYQALQNANLSLGIETVENISEAVPVTEDIVVRLHSVMGVEIPEVDPLSDEAKPCYSLLGSSGAMDEAYAKFRKITGFLAGLAEIESSVCRLAVQIRRTNRRVNALEKIVIPDDLAQIHFISDALEESDREDFTRMKMSQKKKQQKEDFRG